jgi:hypothetical protein
MYLSNACHEFWPEALPFVFDLTADSTNLNFEAYLENYNISGGVTSDTGTLSGVTVRASSAGTSLVLMSDSSGDFSFTNLCHGTWALVPSRLGYAFDPPTTNVTINSSSGSISGISFAGHQVYSVSGHVYATNGLVGVTLIASNASDYCSTRTVAGGDYSLGNLRSGTYQIFIDGPEASFFSPSITNVTVPPSQIDVDFLKVPSIKNITSTNAGQIQFTVEGRPNQTFTIWASTNLATNGWQIISTNTASSNGVFIFLDTNATNWPKRFYRSGK